LGEGGWDLSIVGLIVEDTVELVVVREGNLLNRKVAETEDV